MICQIWYFVVILFPFSNNIVYYEATYMNFLLTHFVPYLLLYKYVAVFAVAFVAAVIIPIPSGSVLMATAAFASNGYFNITWVIVISIIANILGDNLSYYLGHKYGKKTLEHIGFRKVLASENFKTVEQRFKKHPGLIVFVSRFEVVSTLSVNLLSGMGKISYKNFLAHEVVGSIAQVCMYAYIGYTFGDNWQLISSVIGKLVLTILCIIVVGFIFFKKKKSKTLPL